MTASNSLYEAALDRVGVRPCGGNMTAAPNVHPVTGQKTTNAAWSNERMGIFVLDHPCPTSVDFNAKFLRDSIVCGIHLNNEATVIDVGRQSFEGHRTYVNMVFVPQGERMRFSTSVDQGLQSVTIVVDVASVVATCNLNWSDLPRNLRTAIKVQKPILEQLPPALFKKIACDIVMQPMRTIVPSLYYEAKACELTAALMTQIMMTSRDQPQRGFTGNTFAALERVRSAINANPGKALDIDYLSALAAMNRTKLREAFKACYGLTLYEYRMVAILQIADKHLRNSGKSVQEVAALAGYSNPSSFIVAYKRQFGSSPGILRARD